MGADIAPGTQLVLNHDGLPQSRLGTNAPLACRQIHHAPGRPGNHQPNRLGWIGLGLHPRGQGQPGGVLQRLPEPLVLQREGGQPFTIVQKSLDEADIRDVDFLNARRKKERLNLVVWNLARAAAAVLILSLVTEVAAAGISWRAGQLKALNESRRGEVAEIEADQATASRIEDVRTKSPLALEMLALANEQRPSTVEFTRINCKTNTSLEIEARTTNPADISAFEKGLKDYPEVSAVASKDMRARDNYTTFTFTLTFKVDTLRKTVAKADSGIYLRGTPQVQIWDLNQVFDPKKPDRKPHLGSGGLFNNTPGAPGRDPLVVADKPFGEWNSFRIIQQGDITTVWLNGKLVVDHAKMENYWDHAKPLPANGPIMLQTHGGEIRWRNLFVKTL